MKEQYTSPELELKLFLPAETLAANDEVDIFDKDQTGPSDDPDSIFTLPL